MLAFSALQEDESTTALFKSLRYLISKAILANPEGAAAAAVVFCEEEKERKEIPEHMVKQLEMWAAKYTQEGRALNWHQILKALGLPERPKIEQREGEAAASIDFRGPTRGGDPASILALNINGMNARWKRREAKITSTRNQNPEQEVILEDHDKSKWPNGRLEQVLEREEPASAPSRDFFKLQALEIKTQNRRSI
jgi:hypothetical protein